MKTVAIIGAGAVAAETAHQLAALEVAAEIRLIDAQPSIAAGKALDIQQSGAIRGSGVRLAGASELTAASGASAIVVADRAGSDDAGPAEAVLDDVRRIAAASPRTPLIFACPAHYEVMQLASRELRLDPNRMLGTAPEALLSASRALLALAAGVSPAEAVLALYGVPQQWVFGWSEAMAGGRPASASLAAHEIAAVERRAHASWPPGPYALASAAARAVSAVLARSRRRLTCFAAIEDGEWRGRIAAIPLVAGPQGIAERQEPALSARERVQLASALAR